MSTMKGILDLYLKCNVSLLVDVFEKLKSNSLNNCGLCPSHSLSAPGLRWNAMLKLTKIELELIPGPYLYIFIGKCTRGGISYISNRYSKVNNKYLKFYDPKREPKQIT